MNLPTSSRRHIRGSYEDHTNFDYIVWNQDRKGKFPSTILNNSLPHGISKVAERKNRSHKMA